ncbi:hypothetical protein SA496_24810 [Pseudomonas sp. JS3066]|jgi:hypothetical protein|uniref:hypothetical protein n=1 Tax=unclassified Pseudomonas TaxID=196821 RepID=UPI000EA86FAD|nr:MULTISPECIES: hypothetical protein [unclassified Pseudomonas]AYF89551.1 hypothetical protein D6Z43_21250 [Pseudomonas sp. DY-1]MDH4656095.1 hypothetical protein [Pseudomonas sp. BN606]MRK21296.1 hypothetical protein [Pseudomonas sp. JG-B]WVK92894.1 hypothetical protein SA496_24810 [Pseudomonas sp. JS3066]
MLSLQSAPVAREDHWHPHTAQLQAREMQFAILAEAEADILGRLLAFFAQLQLVPHWLEVNRLGDNLLVQLRQPGLTPHRAEVIAQKMRSLVSVFSVELEPFAIT